MTEALEVENTPDWFRTFGAQWRHNNIIGAALNSPTLAEWMSQSDPTPVDDEYIVAEADRVGLGSTEDLARFARHTTRGQVDATIRQVLQERRDRQTIENAPGHISFVTGMATGILDPVSWVGGGLAGRTAQSLAPNAGRLTQASIAAAGAGLTQTAVQELALDAIQETRGPIESISNIAGATIGGAVLGPVIAKLFGGRTINKVGEGIKAEVDNMTAGRVEAEQVKADTDLVQATVDHAIAPSYIERVKAHALENGGRLSTQEVADFLGVDREVASRVRDVLRASGDIVSKPVPKPAETPAGTWSDELKAVELKAIGRLRFDRNASPDQLARAVKFKGTKAEKDELFRRAHNLSEKHVEIMNDLLEANARSLKYGEAAQLAKLKYDEMVNDTVRTPGQINKAEAVIKDSHLAGEYLEFVDANPYVSREDAVLLWGARLNEGANSRRKPPTSRRSDDDVDPPAPRPADADAPESIPPTTPKAADIAQARAVGQDFTPSEWAQTKQIAEGLGVKHSDFLSMYRQVLENGPSYDYHHDKGSVARAIQQLNRLGGGNPALDLTFSMSRAMREAVFNFANIQSHLSDGQTTPSQVMNLAARAYGEQGIAKRSILEAHKEWYTDLTKNQPVEYIRARFTGGAHGREEFSDLVTQAAALGDAAVSHKNAARLMHPAVQKAAKAFRAFDDFMGDELVRSGLMRKGHRQPNHVSRVYTGQVIADELTFKARAAEAHFEKHLAEDVAEADAALASRVAHLDEFVEKQLTETIDQVRTQYAKAEQAGVEEAIRGSLVKKMELASAQKHGLAYARELQTIETRVAREKQAEYNRLHAIAKLKRSKRYSADDIAEAQEKLLSLDAKYVTRLEELQAAAEREFDATVVVKKAGVDARVDAWVTREMNKLSAALERQVGRAEDKAIRQVKRQYESQLRSAYAKHAAATGPEARAKLELQSRNHADGVFHAIAHHETGAGNGGRLTGGNVRGSRHETNVHIPTSELVERGWISTDVFEIMHKTARQDGIDAAMARKFRRPPTDQEKVLAMRNSPEAYWRDGGDPNSVPDLDMRGVKEAARSEYDAMRAKATTPEERRDLAQAQVRDLENLETMIGIARGTHLTDRSAAADLARAFNFAVFMGKNTITNMGDAAKIMLAHGVSTPLSYLGLRLREWGSSGTLKNLGKQELREYAAAINVGLEKVNMTRMLGATDQFDPFSTAVRAGRMDRWASFLTEIGSKAFLINHMNDALKTAAFGIAQHRLGKIALTGKMSETDKEWMRFIGIDATTLKELTTALGEQGVTYTASKPIRFDIRSMHPNLSDKLVAAFHKENTATIVQPDALSKPLAFRHPLIGLMTQFSSFALQSGMSTTNVLGQRLRHGEMAAPIAGITAMASLAYFTQWLSIWSDGNEAALRRFEAAHERNPGFVAYNTLDRTGLLGPFTYLSNFTDDFLNVGARSALRSAMGDDVKDRFPFSKKKFGEGNNGDAWKTAGGPLARTVTDVFDIGRDVAGSLVGSRYGYVPLMLSEQRVTQKTAEKAQKYVPFVNAFYTRWAVENYVTAPLSSDLPKSR